MLREVCRNRAATTVVTSVLQLYLPWLLGQLQLPKEWEGRTTVVLLASVEVGAKTVVQFELIWGPTHFTESTIHYSTAATLILFIELANNLRLKTPS